MSEAVAGIAEFLVLQRRVDRLEREVADLREQSVPGGTAAAASPAGDLEGGVTVSDKDALRADAREVLRSLGIPEDPGVTPEELQQRMMAGGVDPDECLASRAIVTARQGEK